MKVGSLYRIGGKNGMIMRCHKIDGDSAVLKTLDNCCTFYYQKGDCSLFPFKEHEQLSLFLFQEGGLLNG